MKHDCSALHRNVAGAPFFPSLRPAMLRQVESTSGGKGFLTAVLHSIDPEQDCRPEAEELTQNQGTRLHREQVHGG